MPQSLAALSIHLVFSTKDRVPFLTPEIELELFPYMATIFQASHSPALIINGAADHVHCLFSLAHTVAVCDVVEEVKRESSKWIKTKGNRFESFHWQAGYGAFSIGQSQVEVVKQYIAG